MNKKLLEIKDLEIVLKNENRDINLLEDINFSLDHNSILGLVGETGSGKTITALSIMRLLDKKSLKLNRGSIFFKGKDLLKYSKKSINKIRGKEISMIFQEPMISLNPVFTVGNQISEVIRTHKNISYNESKKIALNLFNKVKLPYPESIFNKYPYELSGGMKQRILISMALSMRPSLIIADEPTTALDVTTQSNILGLIKQIQEEEKISVLFITHDLGVVAQLCENVCVMYSGNIVEISPVNKLFEKPLHPYSKGLIDSIIPISEKAEKISVIPGDIPNVFEKIEGCKFHPRCSNYIKGVCDIEKPELVDINNHRKIACFNPLKRANDE